MAADEMVEPMREAYEAWIGGNPAPALGLLADDITWEVPGNSVLSGTYTGAEEITAMWEKLPEHLRGLEVHEFFAKDDTILVTNTITLDIGSDYRVDEWKVRDGKVVSFRSIGDPSLFERAFGSK